MSGLKMFHAVALLVLGIALSALGVEAMRSGASKSGMPMLLGLVSTFAGLAAIGAVRRDRR